MKLDEEWLVIKKSTLYVKQSDGYYKTEYYELKYTHACKSCICNRYEICKNYRSCRSILIRLQKVLKQS